MRIDLKILFLSRWFPYPVDNGSKIRIFNLLKLLSSKHRVDLISFHTDPVLKDHIRVIEQYSKVLGFVPHRQYKPNSFHALTGFFSKIPRSDRYTYSEVMQNIVDNAIHRNDYDLLIASQIDMVPYLRQYRNIPKILETPKGTKDEDYDAVNLKLLRELVIP